MIFNLRRYTNKKRRQEGRKQLNEGAQEYHDLQQSKFSFWKILSDAMPNRFSVKRRSGEVEKPGAPYQK